MKFLKVLVNSILSGVFFAGLLALLVYDININLPFDAAAMGRLAIALAVPYGPVIVLFLILLFFIVQFFTGRKFPVKAVSPTFLAASFALLIALFLVIFGENLAYFRSFFDAATYSLLRSQAIVLGALALLAPAFLYLAGRTKRSALPLAAFFLVFILGTAYAVTRRAAFPLPRKASATGRLEARRTEKNVVLIGLEGLTFDFILPLISEGKLPNISWLVENGSWGRLQTLAPTDSFILDQSVRTGKFPSKHRRISTNSGKMFFGNTRLEATPRFIFFRQMFRLGLFRTIPNDPLPGPMDIGRIVEANGMKALSSSPVEGAFPPAADPRTDRAFGTAFKVDPAGKNRLLDAARSAFAADHAREESALAEKARVQPRLFHLRLDGLNTVEAFFYKYSFPELFGSIAQDDINRYGQVIAHYYEYYDQLIGKYLAGLKDNEILVVYSPFGLEPLPLWKRFAEWIMGNSEISATHEDTPDGAVFFYGNGIEKRNSLEDMSVVDIAPTLLYYLGLPVGRDMDGIVRSQVFVREFTAENPIFAISSYEEFEIGRPKDGISE
jgi:hypothetical protein